MSAPVKVTPAERVAAANERRAALKALEAEAHAEQQASDIERLVDLEEKHGFDRVLRIDLGGWKPGAGAATMLVARVPLASEPAFKRFQDTIAKPKTDHIEAANTLAATCIVYPHRKDDKDLYEATLELAPGILSAVAAEVVKAAMGHAEEEKKG